MKLLSKIALVNLLYLTTTLPAVADDANTYNQQQTATSTQNLVKYLVNLGGYLGYNVTQSPTDNKQKISQTLLGMTLAQLIDPNKMYTTLYNTLLGTIPPTALAQFLPNTTENKNVFQLQNYSSPSQTGTNVAVNPLIDQKQYQQDPVSQSILNILSTPNSTYCMNNDGTAWKTDCTLLFNDLVATNIVGDLPKPEIYFTSEYNQNFITQLNSDSLVAPLLYSTETANNNGEQRSIGLFPAQQSKNDSSDNKGLTAQSPAQVAQNFILYASGLVTPPKLPSRKGYDDLYSQATGKSGVPMLQQEQALAILSNYFTTLRTYAAQASVGLNNLYFIMAKRLPQTPSDEKSGPTSQAKSEFMMATWRLFNPDMTNNGQWVTQLNTASPATVQKEIATLLAEISYQMYLDRQIQERILLTNSIMLMQNTRSTQPSSDFTGAGNAATTTGSPQ